MEGERSVRATLEGIATGGERVVAIVNDRLMAAQLALLDGEFDKAEDRIEEARHMCSLLSVAERGLKLYAQNVELVLPDELEVGAIIHGYGECTDIDTGARGPLGARKVKATYLTPDGEESFAMMDPERPVVVETAP